LFVKTGGISGDTPQGNADATPQRVEIREIIEVIAAELGSMCGVADYDFGVESQN
jgi:hypothetical protein